MQKIKSGDEVIAIAGKNKGQRGTVMRFIDNGKRVLVQNVNMVSKHEKPNPQLNKQGGIVKIEAPMQISNVAIYNPKTEKADRVGFKLNDDKKYVRVFRSSQEEINS